MGKLFAVILVVVVLVSAVPIVLHTWTQPVDISTHGLLIDDQMADTMVEVGCMFLAAQILLGIFVWKFSNRGVDAEITSFPGGPRGLVIAAFIFAGIEVLALGILGQKAWA